MTSRHADRLLHQEPEACSMDRREISRSSQSDQVNRCRWERSLEAKILEWASTGEWVRLKIVVSRTSLNSCAYRLPAARIDQYIPHRNHSLPSSSSDRLPCRATQNLLLTLRSQARCDPRSCKNQSSRRFICPHQYRNSHCDLPLALRFDCRSAYLSSITSGSTKSISRDPKTDPSTRTPGYPDLLDLDERQDSTSKHAAGSEVLGTAGRLGRKSERVCIRVCGKSRRCERGRCKVGKG